MKFATKVEWPLPVKSNFQEKKFRLTRASAEEELSLCALESEHRKHNIIEKNKAC